MPKKLPKDMSIWRDMKRFRTGRTPEGHDVFSIPLTPDEEGMVGRECSQSDCQPKYFKIYTGDSERAEDGEKNAIEYIYCPYCGYKDYISQFTTREQLQWIESMIVRDIHKAFDDMMRDAFRSTRTTPSRGFFTVSLEYKPGILPSVRHYAEQELQRVVDCDQCSKKYAVYGIAMFCPWCGKGNLRVHLIRSIEIIQSLMDSYDRIVESAGKEAGYHLLGNCLEDCVSLFEGFLKAIYKNRLQGRFSPKDCLEKLKRLRNSFQNLNRAKQIYQQDIGIDIFSGISPTELDFMEFEFAKRHVITHNLGLVDDKYKQQATTWQTTGQDISLDAEDIQNLLSLIQKVIEYVI